MTRWKQSRVFSASHHACLITTVSVKTTRRIRQDFITFKLSFHHINFENFVRCCKYHGWQFTIIPYHICMEEVFTRRHKIINIVGPDRLSSGRNLSPGLFIWPPYIFPSCTYGYLGGILVSITDFWLKRKLFSENKALFKFCYYLIQFIDGADGSSHCPIETIAIWLSFL